MSVQCAYCGADYGSNPANIPTDEHVLTDSFGARLELPRGVVCKSCNDLFNREIDGPLRDSFLALLRRHDIRSSKRRNQSVRAAGSVTANTTAGPLPGKILPGGTIQLEPGISPLEHIGEDAATARLIAASPEHLASMLKTLAEQCREIRIVDSPPLEINSVVVEFSFSRSVLFRAAAKAALNYLFLRRPQDRLRPELEPIKRFVLRGADAMPVVMGSLAPAFTGQLEDVREIVAEHFVAVGSNGADGLLQGGVVLFGVFHVQLELCREWRGGSFHAEHFFDAIRGTNRPMDREFIHPKQFQSFAEKGKNHIVRIFHPLRGELLLHRVRAGARLMDCTTCSNPRSGAFPSSPEAIRDCPEWLANLDEVDAALYDAQRSR